MSKRRLVVVSVVSLVTILWLCSCSQLVPVTRLPPTSAFVGSWVSQGPGEAVMTLTLAKDGQLELDGAPREVFASFDTRYYRADGKLLWHSVVDRVGTWRTRAELFAGEASIDVMVGSVGQVPAATSTLQFERQGKELVLWTFTGDFDGIDPQRIYFTRP